MSHNDPRQVIIVSTQAKMPKGKLAAQVAHASIAALLNLSERSGEGLRIPLEPGSAAEQWLSQSFTKVVVKCDDPEEMQQIFAVARKAGIPSALILDEGRTVFNGEPTLTTVGLGPALPEELAPLTQHLKLL